MNEKTNIIAMFSEPYKIELTEKPIPSIQSDYVLVEYLYCGICGGDYSVYCGNRQIYPVSLGHEFVGRVLTVGKSVNNIDVGQYVVSDFNYRCNECEYCLSQKSHLCIKNSDGLFSNRGFAKYASIHSSYLIPIEAPSFIPRACLIEPLSCIIHASNVAKIKEGMNILLCGGGSIGMLFCFLLQRTYQNINITVSEINQNKLAQLIKHFNVKQYNNQGNQRYDLIIDCSNSTTGLKFALDNAKSFDRICIMSHLYGLETSFVFEQACKKELQCVFPLRNGEKNNLIVASNYINQFWSTDDDEMLCIYESIDEAFRNKPSSSCCKQIVCSSKLITS